MNPKSQISKEKAQELEGSVETKILEYKQILDDPKTLPEVKSRIKRILLAMKRAFKAELGNCQEKRNVRNEESGTEGKACS